MTLQAEKTGGEPNLKEVSEREGSDQRDSPYSDQVQKTIEESGRREGHHEANRNINRANQEQGQRLEVNIAIRAQGYSINQNQGQERESVLG